jgi:hypothetical protein
MQPTTKIGDVCGFRVVADGTLGKINITVPFCIYRATTHTHTAFLKLELN